MSEPTEDTGQDGYHPGTGGGLLRDERGNVSAARVLLMGWLLQATIYAFVGIAQKFDVSNAVVSMDAGVATALIAWAAGPRIAQYIGGQIGSVATGVGASLRSVVQKRRDPVEGVEPAP